MNTERTEKFVNAIACDLEEGGFRQVSGTTLRRTLATAVSAALPLLEAGNPVSGLAEQQGLAFDVDDARERFEEWAKGRDLTPDTWGVSSYVSPHVDNDWDVWRAAWKALAATGKQQVGEVQEDAPSIDYEDLLDQTKDLIHCGCSVDGAFEWLLEQLTDGEAIAARQPGAQEELHGFLKNSTPLREAALRALGFIDRSDEHGRTAFEFLRRELHAECAAQPAQGIDLGQLWEPIKEAVHTALSAHMMGISQKKRESVAVYVARLLRDGQRDAAPGVGNG